MTRPTLQARQVSKAFAIQGVGATVVDAIDLDLNAGEMTLLMGPSGSGKSTLLAMMSGLLRPDSGDVLAFGERLWNRDDRGVEAFRRAHCGFVFQGFNLFPALTAREQVVIALEHAGLPPAEAHSRADLALAEVGLTARAHALPAQLSGGEKQRVAVARAIAKHPQLLFADEPSSALDRENGRRVALLLRRAARERGATVFCVTHDTRLFPYADRILSIEDGRLVDDVRASQDSPNFEIAT